MITLTGKKVSEGIVIGRLGFYQRGEREVRRIGIEDEKKELLRFERAREKAAKEISELCEVCTEEMGEANAAIFELQQSILEDDEFVNGILRIITEEKLNAEYALSAAAENFLSVLGGKNPNYVKGREADIRDLVSRLLRILGKGRKERLAAEETFIMAAKDLYPSEAVLLDRTKVLGFVTMYGAINSHTAVLARTKGIPSVIGLGEALKKDYDGKMVILDGFEGKLYIEPDQTTMESMKEKKRRVLQKTETFERLKGKENVTQGGQRIDICANIGSREDIESVLRNDANGIGLFRSEFLYMREGKKPPTEDEQFQAYRLAAEAMGDKRVVIRTADLGGDKQVEWLGVSAERNPAMGYRGIRISLDREEIFNTQLRAVLRASAFGNVAVMFPMITSVEEAERAKEALERAKGELRGEKAAFNERLEVGAMIETPAAVMISGELARKLDFFSIGTNDLTQYTLAADRTNAKLLGYYDPHHAALMKMIRIVANNVHLEGKRIGICGDLAADTTLTEAFIRMGIDELSVTPGRVLPLRKKIREIQ